MVRFYLIWQLMDFTVNEATKDSEKTWYNFKSNSEELKYQFVRMDKGQSSTNDLEFF